MQVAIVYGHNRPELEEKVNQKLKELAEAGKNVMDVKIAAGEDGDWSLLITYQ